MLIRLLYTFVLALVSPFFIYGLLKSKKGKPVIGQRWREYFGYTPSLSSSEPPVWIHAVSVGETIAAIPIIKELKAQQPSIPILLTTTTTTGAEQARKLGELVEHRYMPLDFPFAINLFLRTVSPSKLLIMETELWPNTLHEVAKKGIPITILNARLSERSCQRYNKILPVFRMLASNLSNILCQHKDDAERFKRLGVPGDQIHVTGSVKFDIKFSDETISRGNELRCKLGKKRPIWIAASTHEGEDEKLLSVHISLLESFPDALMIVVPRHPERFESVRQLAIDMDLNCVSRTSNINATEDTQVYIGDTMGEMMILLQAADICFVGGSLLGGKVGGHNLLEPAALSKALLNGPSYYNFTDITQQLIKADAVDICNNEQDILRYLLDLFNNPEKLKQKGHAAASVVHNNQGALSKTMKLITHEDDK